MEWLDFFIQAFVQGLGWCLAAAVFFLVWLGLGRLVARLWPKRRAR